VCEESTNERKKLSAMFFNELKIPCKIQAQTISILEKKVNKIAQKIRIRQVCSQLFP